MYVCMSLKSYLNVFKHPSFELINCFDSQLINQKIHHPKTFEKLWPGTSLLQHSTCSVQKGYCRRQKTLVIFNASQWHAPLLNDCNPLSGMTATLCARLPIDLTKKYINKRVKNNKTKQPPDKTTVAAIFQPFADPDQSESIMSAHLRSIVYILQYTLRRISVLRKED